MEDLRNLQRKDVCDNNCEPIKSVVDLKSATIIQYTIKGRFMSR